VACRVDLLGRDDGLVQAVWPIVGRVHDAGWRGLAGSAGGGPPDILTSDQGSQVTRLDFTRRLAAAGIRMSMDGRGRALDNIFVERLWRTVTYAEVYLKDDRPPREAIQGWEQCFALDHEQRPHQARGD
jgi:putative transposase